MKIEFTVPGIPLARKAHQHRKVGDKVIKYLPKECESHQNLIKLCASKAMKGQPPIDKMVDVHIEAFWPPVKSLKAMQKGMMKQYGSIPYPKRADADNIAKNVLDGLKGIVITDDNLVVALHVYKRMREIPGTEIVVQERES